VEEKGDFLGAQYALVSASEENDMGVVLLEREGHIETDGGTVPLKLQKRFEIDPGRAEIVCRYSIENQGREPVGLVFGVEWNFTLLAADTDDRYLTIDGERYKMNSEENSENVTDWAMTDEHFRFAVECHSDKPVTLARYPVETVSQSEGGFESNYQGTAFIALLPMYIEPSAAVAREFRIAVKRI
jgi:alpha-amylase